MRLIAGLLLLVSFSALAQQPSMDVTLTWTPPTMNTDGTPLTDLAGYKIYWGPRGGPYPNSTTVNNAGLSSYIVTGQNLQQNTEVCFVVTALNSLQRESVFSNEACKTTPDIPDVPEAPSNLTVEITLNFGA